MTKDKTMTIKKKLFWAASPVPGIVRVLLATAKGPEALLFLIGVGVGIFIGKALFEVKKSAEGKKEE